MNVYSFSLDRIGELARVDQPKKTTDFQICFDAFKTEESVKRLTSDAVAWRGCAPAPLTSVLFAQSHVACTKDSRAELATGVVRAH